MEPSEDERAAFVRVFFHKPEPPAQGFKHLVLVETLFNHVPDSVQAYPVLARGHIPLNPTDDIRAADLWHSW